jgi:hypothetical protein
MAGIGMLNFAHTARTSLKSFSSGSYCVWNFTTHSRFKQFPQFINVFMFYGYIQILMCPSLVTKQGINAPTAIYNNPNSLLF